MRRALRAIVTLIAFIAAGAHGESPPAIYHLSTTYLSDAYLTSHGSQPLTIWGANLTGTSKVTIGGAEADSVTVVDDSTVTCSAKKPGKYAPYTKVDIVLTAAGGTVTLPNAIAVGVQPGLGVTAKGSDWAVLVEAVVAGGPSPSITLKLAFGASGHRLRDLQKGAFG